MGTLAISLVLLSLKSEVIIFCSFYIIGINTQNIPFIILKTITILNNTVWMKSLTMFSEDLRLLHNHDINLAHILAFKNLVIRSLNAKR